MIHTEQLGSVTVLRMQHGKVNALDAELLERLSTELEQVERSPARALVLTGGGRSFSAGVDLWRVLDGGEPYLKRFVPLLRQTLTQLFAFPRPVVAAINGHAIAGGCVLACACDYRIMAAGTARLGVPELHVGVPFPSIAFEIVTSVAPTGLLSRLIYLGELFDPQEAEQSRLVDEIVAADELLARACEVADHLAAIPPETYRVTKRQLREPALERAARNAKTVDNEVERIWGSEAVTAAIRAYMEKTVRKRPPAS